MGKHAQRKDPEDLNLIPLMNLFVTMIPLLLLTAAFYHIGMVSVSVPTQSESESDVPTGKNSVTVNLRMTAKGLVLSASSATLPEEELKSLDALIPKREGKHDLERLTRVLEGVKKRYEQSNTLMLIPAKQSRYEDMIATMDAARDMSVTVEGKKRRIPLFPVVVVTSLVQ